ncbi:lipopolysaccharide transport periplasmic protein LptA [Sansalvadorimonas sp. 2012CJ34-2]|uniref:Lipopolysaccharide export system protein LptA n=1 Tax=Parendozoicomonas callyspongiae TaxID=2942213 RepID=A0ABT0PBY3_9GAMM|nr:lipopolysaccharide transport periplasmic protein LptA [Sansalvadorimonas sp. 2012CJ34-2]MCL6268892.1 lipopolysaccharide transport periplasmic protein LptA [Sansalvadorimonas sp. 2012CJ34-2]
MKVARLCVTLAAALIATQLWALPDDRNQPIYISSDSADIDDAKGIAIYRGDVEMTQGTTKLTGDIVTIYSKNREIQRVVSEGKKKQAYYEELQSEEKGKLKAWGKTIDYDFAVEKIELIKQAKLIQKGDTFTGDHIEYDQAKQLVNATGQQGGKTGGRVQMVIQPSQTK